MTDNTSELHDLRARLDALEATVAAMERPHLPDRRSWLKMLAGAGALSMVGNIAQGESTGAATPLGAWKTYSPKLMGEKEDPLVGIDEGPGYKRGGRNGHYWQHGRTVVVKTWIQFGRGMKPGSGQYRLSLPVPAAMGSDAWLGPTGMALLHRDATNINRNASVVLAHPDFVAFQIDNLPGNLGHNNPWVWAEFDGLNTFMIYEAANDA
ncbi:hypothetical protein AYO47_07595 [Planctomyces sp. SCGC AG-212-M04]|nr:hypothetical protein AYO47_07595 [Planctomyces sp. SCGC AG-212-M04]